MAGQPETAKKEVGRKCYKAHIAGPRWTGWFKNVEMCGNRSTGKAIEAIEIYVSDNK